MILLNTKYAALLILGLGVIANCTLSFIVLGITSLMLIGAAGSARGILAALAFMGITTGLSFLPSAGAIAAYRQQKNGIAITVSALMLIPAVLLYSYFDLSSILKVSTFPWKLLACSIVDCSF